MGLLVLGGAAPTLAASIGEPDSTASVPPGDTAKAVAPTKAKIVMKKLLPPIESVLKRPSVPPLPKKILQNVTVGGYFRAHGYNRKLRDAFPVIPSNEFASAPPYVLGVGDVYRDPPLMLLTVGARPNSRTYVGMDFSYGSFFTGDIDSPRPLALNLGINLTGSIRTEHGKFGVQAGGINWTRLSDLTLGAPEIRRYSLYERSPWDGNIHSTDRAQGYFDNGAVAQDNRFGQQAFKGIIFDGSELPQDFSFRVLYGKTAVNGNLTDSLPNYAYGGTLRKNFGKNEISYNTINYVNFIDSLGKEQAGINIHTLAYNWKWKGIQFYGEMGMGRQFASDSARDDWGEAIVFKIKTPKKLTYLPFELGLFQISPDFRNFFGAFQSSGTSLEAATAQVAPSGIANGTAASFGGSIADVGQLTNNRRGFYLNTEWEIGDFKINVGNMVATEMEIQGNRMAFGHKLNALPLSRLVTFSNNVGPYGRWTSFFRGYFEEIAITDVDTLTGMPTQRNTFNMLQAQLMQRFTIRQRPLYVFYIGSFGSAQSDFSAIPIFSDEAYLRAHYHEFDAFYELNSWLTPVLTLGLERIRGNENTNRGDNVDGILGSLENDPLNQTSTLMGFGLDMILSNSTGLFIRHRRFTQSGDSFIQDDIQGHETTVELKIFF